MNAKKLLTLLLSALMILSCLSAALVVSADETADKFAPTNEETIQLYSGEQGAALGNYGKGHSFGAKVTVPAGGSVTLKPGQSIIVDTGNVAGFEPSVQMDIQTVPGAKNILFGGEGIFNTVLTGPGRVWLQTMPIYNVANAIRPYIPTSSD